MEIARANAKAPSHVQFGRKLTSVPLGSGVDDLDDLRDELMGYIDVLNGRVDPPIESPYLNLMEVATAYHSRACEIEFLIYDAERQGLIKRGEPLYRFRTGQLQSFINMSKRASDMGSRRLTQESLLTQQRLEK